MHPQLHRIYFFFFLLSRYVLVFEFVFSVREIREEKIEIIRLVPADLCLLRLVVDSATR